MQILTVLTAALVFVGAVAQILVIWRQSVKLDADEERERRRNDMLVEPADVRGRDSDAA